MPIDAWLARFARRPQSSLHLGSSPEDDVEDPIGRRPAVYERVADELDDLVTQFVDLVWSGGRTTRAAVDNKGASDALAG